MIDVYLTSVPFISPTYQNVIDFGSKVSRDNWFNNKKDKVVKTNLKYDCNRTTVTVSLPIEEANDFDYLFYDSSDRRFFYFITSVEYNTPSSTVLLLQLDVFNTYFYDCQLNKTFVDRCHVDRWDGDIPTYNLEDEGLSLGEYIQDGVEEICQMGNNVIVASSVPVGKIVMANEGFGSSNNFGTGAYGGTSWKDGKMSSQGFRMLKGFEGYCPTAYQDSGGVWTIGYGITEHGEPNKYAELLQQQPCSEEVCAKIAYDSICENYGAKILDTCVKLGITEQYQFDALCDMAYNRGYGKVTGSNDLMNAIANNPTDEATIRPIWESSGVTDIAGNYLEGLVARRKAECDMYFGQTVEFRPITNVSDYSVVTENDGNGWLPQDDSYANDDSTEGYNGHKVISNELWDAWLVPVTGAYVSSLYGWRTLNGAKDWHDGIDLACPTGTPVLASSSGTVVNASYGYNGGAGNNVIIEHPNGSRSKYYHLNSIDVEVGQTVKRTQKIGEVGNTGHSFGSHLHWEFRNTSNESINPIPSAKKGDKF